MYEDKEFELAARYEQMGGLVNLGVRVILAHPGYKLTPDMHKICETHAEQIAKEIEVLVAKASTKGSEEKEATRRGLLACFGGELIHYQEIPNGYCSQACCVNRPWYIVTSRIGPVAIGWRKRVIQISWDGSDVEAGGNALFPNENTTKGDRYIHAWGYEKAKEYIQKLLTSTHVKENT
jgi:hypothetical protein